MLANKLLVIINGTDYNPWHKMGLTQNPFPQVPQAELSHHMQGLAELDSDPIKNEAQIREILTGWSQEFVDLCCQRFKVGERVRFVVTYGK